MYRYKPNVFWHKCKECGRKNGEYYIQAKGPHYGIYCDNCGKWIKWIKQYEIDAIMSKKNINKIFDSFGHKTTIAKEFNRSEIKPLNEYINVDTLSEEELSKLDLPF